MINSAPPTEAPTATPILDPFEEAGTAADVAEEVPVGEKKAEACALLANVAGLKWSRGQPVVWLQAFDLQQPKKGGLVSGQT